MKTLVFKKHNDYYKFLNTAKPGYYTAIVNNKEFIVVTISFPYFAENSKTDHSCWRNVSTYKHSHFPF